MSFNRKLCEWCSVLPQYFLSAVFKWHLKFPAQCSADVKINNTCCQGFPPLEAPLVLYNASGPFSATPATDVKQKTIGMDFYR